MDQGLELAIWLGMAGVALVWAHLMLWHTHHVLNRAWITSRVQITPVGAH